MSQVYQRMSLAEREELSIRHAQGLGVRAIARELGRSPSTISRELARNRSGFYYRAVTAQNKAAKRCYRKPRRLAVDRQLRHTVFRLLRRQWSPQQISGYLRERRSPGNLQVSAETIYSYLYVLPRGELRRELLSHLRQHRKHRRPRSRGADRRGQIPEMISIEERPAALCVSVVVA